MLMDTIQCGNSFFFLSLLSENALIERKFNILFSLIKEYFVQTKLFRLIFIIMIIIIIKYSFFLWNVIAVVFVVFVVVSSSVQSCI